MELAFVPHDAPDGGMHYVVSGKGAMFPMSDGLAGGYPGSPNAYVWVHNNDLNGEQKKQISAASTYEDIPGEKEAIDWGVFPLMGEDALYVRWNGGGGYGDPMRRPIEQVVADIASGHTSEKMAEQIYGVILTSEGSLNEDATRVLREELQANRLSTNKQAA